MAEPAFKTHQNTAPRYKPRHHNAMPHDTAHIRVPFLGMSLRRITAARASRRRPATHGTADGRCHAAPCHRHIPPGGVIGAVVGWRVWCAAAAHYTLLWNTHTTTKLGMKLPSTHRSQKFRDPYSPEGGVPKGHMAKHANTTGTWYQKFTTRGMGEKRLKNGRTVTHLHTTLQSERLMCVFKEIRVVP